MTVSNPQGYAALTRARLLERYRAGSRSFSRCELPEGASLCGETLADAVFDEAWIDSVDFRNADLRGASFRSAHLKCCTFDGADLTGADFRDAAIDAATFLGARFDGAHFGGASTCGAVLGADERP